MRTFAQVEAWTEAIFALNGITDVLIYPGPDLPDVPDRHVIWTRYGGPGYEGGEHALDNVSWQARCVGFQDNYNSAEEIADLIDLALTNLRSQHVGGVWVTQVQRVGGAPAPLVKDDAERTHFVCSYNIEQESALPTG